MPIKCPECGSDNPTGSSFCASCGNRFSAAQATPPRPKASQAVTQKPSLTRQAPSSKRRKLGATLTVVVLVVAAVLFVVYYEQQQYNITHTPFTVEFAAANLPAGGSWFVKVGTRNVSSLTSQPISVSLIDGTYDYTSSSLPVGLYEGAPGAVKVSGSNLQVAVSFTAIQQTIVDVSLDIHYNGSTSGYFGPSPQNLNGFTYPAGGQELYFMNFSSGSSSTQYIDSLYGATPGFAISSISAALPVNVAPNGTENITFDISLPWQVYDAPITIVLVTT